MNLKLLCIINAFEVAGANFFSYYTSIEAGLLGQGYSHTCSHASWCYQRMPKKEFLWSTELEFSASIL